MPGSAAEVTTPGAQQAGPADLDPMPLILGWMRDAEATGTGWAAALASATSDGRPSVGMVLLKEVTPRGVIFYSDSGSRKGMELRQNPRAAVCLHWPPLGRQLRVEGHVRRLPAAKVDSYFHSRPLLSQLAAAVSHQSRPAPSRPELEAGADRLALELDGAEVPRPWRWAGYHLECEVVEF